MAAGRWCNIKTRHSIKKITINIKRRESEWKMNRVIGGGGGEGVPDFIETF